MRWQRGPPDPTLSSRPPQGLFLFSRLRAWGFAPRLILDVGANRGEWASSARAEFADATPPPLLLALEGSPAFAQSLRGLGLSFAIALLGAVERTGVPFFDDASTGNSVLKERTIFFSLVDATPSDLHTLDGALAAWEAGEGGSPNPLPRSAVLLKLDVQGYELEVLKGATRTLRGVEVVLLETSVLSYNAGAPLLGEALGALDCLGFAVLDIAQEHLSNEVLIQVDFLLVRKGGLLWDRAQKEAGLI